MHLLSDGVLLCPSADFGLASPSQMNLNSPQAPTGDFFFDADMTSPNQPILRSQSFNSGPGTVHMSPPVVPPPHAEGPSAVCSPRPLLRLLNGGGHTKVAVCWPWQSIKKPLCRACLSPTLGNIVLAFSRASASSTAPQSPGL